MGIKDSLKNTFSAKNWAGVADTKYQPTADEKILPAKNPLPPVDLTAPQDKTFKKQVILEWEGPSKMPDAKKNDKFFRALTIIGFAVILLLLLLQEFVVIVAVLGLVFVYYVVNASPVTQVKYVVTNLGFEYGGEFFPWTRFRYFFVLPKQSHAMFCLDTTDTGVSRLFVFATYEMSDQVREALNEYLPFLEKPPEDFADKVYKNFLNRFSVNESE